MQLSVPEPSLVVLIGASGAGKSTFARAHFRPTEIVSSDVCRGLVRDDENDQAATKDAFELVHFIAGKRLAAGKLTVVDATSVQPDARRQLIAVARAHDVLAVAIVLDLPEALCQERNRARTDRDIGPHVIGKHCSLLRRSLRGLQDEGFSAVHRLASPEEVADVRIERTHVGPDRRAEHGPFDIIGDVHGCATELESLLVALGYTIRRGAEHPFGYAIEHPEGRKALFLGDLVDRGPRIADCLRIAMSMVRGGRALALPGNHENKLLRKLRGKDVKLTHGLAESVAQLDVEPEAFRRDVAEFIDRLVSHYVLDDGKLVVAHAGMKETLQGRADGRVREFALYGDTTGETDELGLPVRRDWASEYRGRATVVYGHTPVLEAVWVNRTINVDTGVVFGGKLTALRWPSLEIVSVPAERAYYAPARPLA